MKQQLHNHCHQLALQLSEHQQERLLDFIQLLTRWNQAYNLTAIKEPEKILTHHIIDSLTVVPHLSGERVLDIGTGAGLPGVPLAIYFADKQFTLLDSVGKKIRFLLQAKAQLDLSNMAPVQERAANYVNPQGFDAIICRAVGSMADIIAESKHLLRENGHWYFMKGAYPQQEIDALDRPFTVSRLSIPGIEAERHIIKVSGEFK